MDTDIPNEMLNGISAEEAKRFGLKNVDDRKEDLLKELEGMGIDKHVLTALSKVRRENFMPDDVKDKAYEDIPLPIGHDQTISQPYTVAYMIQLLDIKPSNKILEIGSGSGYNAAVMSQFLKSGKVYSLEIIKELAEFARKNIEKEKIAHIEIVHANGYEGYEEEALYDRIIVTAASDGIPQYLLDQLKKGGIMVIPVNVNNHQVMTRVVKGTKLEITQHGEFAFVPLRKE